MKKSPWHVDNLRLSRSLVEAHLLCFASQNNCYDFHVYSCHYSASLVSSVVFVGLRRIVASCRELGDASGRDSGRTLDNDNKVA